MLFLFSDRRFLLANAQVDSYPIIYCNDGFCELVGYSRAELMRRPATAEFLHGPLTSQQAAQHIREALAARTERQIEILYYRKDGKIRLTLVIVRSVFFTLEMSTFVLYFPAV